jgi:hypothetical protein
VFRKEGAEEIFGPKRDEATGDGIKLQSEALHDFYSSLNIVQVIKSI